MSVHGAAVLDIYRPRPPGSTRAPAPAAPPAGQRDARVAPAGGGRVRWPPCSAGTGLRARPGRGRRVDRCA